MEVVEDTMHTLKGFTQQRRHGVGGRKLALDLMPEDRMAFRLVLEASQGHGMAGIRDWLQKRFHSIDLALANKTATEIGPKSSSNGQVGVITPGNTPDFVIPKSTIKHTQSLSNLSFKHRQPTSSIRQSRRSELSLQANHSDKQQGIGEADRGEVNSPTNQARGDQSANEHEIHVARARAHTDKTHNSFYERNKHKINIVVINESKPVSEPTEDMLQEGRVKMTPLALPHLSAVTCYGFPTLLESPHTRRKESLLLGSASTDDIYTMGKVSSSSLHNTVLGGRSSQPCTPYDEISHSQFFDSLLVPGMRSLSNSSLSMSNSTTPNDSPASVRSYYRRRSSVPSLTSEESSAETPVFQTQLSEPELGELKLSLTYKKSDSSLRLLLIKAENLCSKDGTEKKLNVFVKVAIMPGKSKRYESRPVKGNNNPIFNEEIILGNISQDILSHSHLRLRVCNQLGGRQYETIGEILLSFNSLGLEHGEEVRMWRDLKPKSNAENPGDINISAKFSPKEDNLYITVIEAQNIHKCQLTGLPDTYVKVTVEQDGKSGIKKQTRTRKSTTHPVFKETFVFCVSPKVDILRYTSVTIQLMSRSHVMNDSVLGEIRLGYQSHTEQQYQHWANIIHNINTDVQQWHTLKPQNRSN